MYEWVKMVMLVVTMVAHLWPPRKGGKRDSYPSLVDFVTHLALLLLVVCMNLDLGFLTLRGATKSSYMGEVCSRFGFAMWFHLLL